jgi:hypothetical protein
MAMTGAALAAARKAKIEAAFGPPTNQAAFDDWLLKDSEAIVEYIQANAEVMTNVTGTVTTGAGAGGAVVGAGQGQVS